MRKDITFEKLMLGGEKVNKSELARRYNCCWETIDRRLNPEKYKKERKTTLYKLSFMYFCRQNCLTKTD